MSKAISKPRPAHIWHQASFISRSTGARLLLALFSALLIAMPWTEQIFTGDHFLRGGDDLELSLLCAITLLGFLIVLAQTSSAAQPTLAPCGLHHPDPPSASNPSRRCYILSTNLHAGTRSLCFPQPLRL